MRNSADRHVLCQVRYQLDQISDEESRRVRRFVMFAAGLAMLLAMVWSGTTQTATGASPQGERPEVLNHLHIDKPLPGRSDARPGAEFPVQRHVPESRS